MSKDGKYFLRFLGPTLSEGHPFFMLTSTPHSDLVGRRIHADLLNDHGRIIAKVFGQVFISYLAGSFLKGRVSGQSAETPEGTEAILCFAFIRELAAKLTLPATVEDIEVEVRILSENVEALIPEDADLSCYELARRGDFVPLEVPRPAPVFGF